MPCNFLMRRAKEGVWSLPRVCCIVWKISERRRRGEALKRVERASLYMEIGGLAFDGAAPAAPKQKVRKGWNGGIYLADKLMF